MSALGGRYPIKLPPSLLAGRGDGVERPDGIEVDLTGQGGVVDLDLALGHELGVLEPLEGGLFHQGHLFIRVLLEGVDPGGHAHTEDYPVVPVQNGELVLELG